MLRAQWEVLRSLKGNVESRAEDGDLACEISKVRLKTLAGQLLF